MGDYSIYDATQPGRASPAKAQPFRHFNIGYGTYGKDRGVHLRLNPGYHGPDDRQKGHQSGYFAEAAELALFYGDNTGLTFSELTLLRRASYKDYNPLLRALSSRSEIGVWRTQPADSNSARMVGSGRVGLGLGRRQGSWMGALLITGGFDLVPERFPLSRLFLGPELSLEFQQGAFRAFLRASPNITTRGRWYGRAEGFVSWYPWKAWGFLLRGERQGGELANRQIVIEAKFHF